MTDKLVTLGGVVLEVVVGETVYLRNGQRVSQAEFKLELNEGQRLLTSFRAEADEAIADVLSLMGIKT